MWNTGIRITPIISIIPKRGPGTSQLVVRQTRQNSMHSIFWWIIVGFIAGVLAKGLVPGDNKEPKGCLYTILLGIGGSVLAGFILHDLLGWQTGGHFIGSIIGATLGAALLIMAFRKFWK